MSLSTLRPAPALLAALVALGSSTAACAERPFYGLGRAMDGDSLMVGDREVRLFGVDAPEYAQTCKKAGRDWACGQEAAAQLSRLVTGRDVRCEPMGVDQHQRTVARCSAGGLDVNRTLVERGFATAFRRYSTQYVPAEDLARQGRRGIWAGEFASPQSYRDAHDPRPERPARAARPARPARPSAATPYPGGCVIKGNRGTHGWIYHLPGMPYYNQTRAEDMFCSEAAAQAAGYRRAVVR